MPITAPKRRRNAVATREAILTSAQAAFARAGYDGVGVREIAAGAGVTAMLINRYFGSKEGLFAEVVVRTMNAANIVTEDVTRSATFGRDLASALVTHTEAGKAPLDGFLIMLRSASNPRAAEIWRGEVERLHHRQVAAVLNDDHAAERAGVVLSLLAGFQFMRQMIGLSALASADREGLIAVLSSAFEHLAGSGSKRGQTENDPCGT